MSPSHSFIRTWGYCPSISLQALNEARIRLMKPLKPIEVSPYSKWRVPMKVEPGLWKTELISYNFRLLGNFDPIWHTAAKGSF